MRDSIDIQILNCLLSNSRVTTTSIADRVGISNVATKQRMSKMEKAGIIKGYTTVLDYSAIGYRTVAYLGIFLEKAKDYHGVIAQLEEVPQIIEAHFTTGNYSIFAKVVAKDNEDLMDILSTSVQSIDGIARTETFISLQEGVNKPMTVGV